LIFELSFNNHSHNVLDLISLDHFGYTSHSPDFFLDYKEPFEKVANTDNVTNAADASEDLFDTAGT